MQEQRRAHISRNNSSSSLRAQTFLHTHSSDPLPEAPKRLGIVSLHLHSLPDISILAEALPSAIRFFATSVFSAPSIVYHAVPHFTGLNAARSPILIARCKPIVRALQSWATQSLGANLKRHVPIDFGATTFAKTLQFLKLGSPTTTLVELPSLRTHNCDTLTISVSLPVSNTTQNTTATSALKAISRCAETPPLTLLSSTSTHIDPRLSP